MLEDCKKTKECKDLKLMPWINVILQRRIHELKEITELLKVADPVKTQIGFLKKHINEIQEIINQKEKLLNG